MLSPVQCLQHPNLPHQLVNRSPFLWSSGMMVKRWTTGMISPHSFEPLGQFACTYWCLHVLQLLLLISDDSVHTWVGHTDTLTPSPLMVELQGWLVEPHHLSPWWPSRPTLPVGHCPAGDHSETSHFSLLARKGTPLSDLQQTQTCFLCWQGHCPHCPGSTGTALKGLVTAKTTEGFKAPASTGTIF